MNLKEMTPDERREHRNAIVRKSHSKHRAKRKIIEDRWREKNKERVKETARLYAKKHRQRINKNQRLRRQRNPEKAKIENHRFYDNPKSKRTTATRRYLKYYGLTREELNRLQILSSGRCEICGQKDENTRSTELHVDHNHKIGKTRGLLCYRCNTQVGKFENLILDLENLIKFAKYLLRKG